MTWRIDGRLLFGTNAPSTSGQVCRPSAEDDLHDGFQCSAIGLVESAEGFTDEALVEGGEDGLDGRRLEEFSRLPMLRIVEETSDWPEDAVADLVDRILRAKYGEVDPSVDKAWQDETRRRIADMEGGRVQGIALEEALAKARKITGQ